MLEFFKRARLQRTEQFKNDSLVKILTEGALEAGHHLEYVPNLQNRNKYQVRYTKPFSSERLVEIICRMEPYVMSLLKKRDIDYTTIDSYIGYGFFNFIKTYKPDTLDTEAKVISAIQRSMMNKIDQLNRKERFRYMPGYTGTTQGYKKDQADKEGVELKARYVNTCKEVSIYTPVFGKDEEESGNYGDFIPDSSPTPEELFLDSDLEEEVYSTYSDNKPINRILLEILIEAGYHGKLSVKDLVDSALHRPDFVVQVKGDYNISILPSGEVIISEESREALHRKIKIFYRGLRKKLKIKFNS